MRVGYILGFVWLAALSVRGQVALYGQCGGKNWTGSTTCVSGAVCTPQNPWYYQCISATSSPTTTTTCASATSAITSRATATTSISTTSTAASASATPTSGCGVTPPASAGKLKFAGVNIAGFDFGMDTDGDGSASAASPPLTQYYGADGPGQMTHFVEDDKFNIFRLPVGWQFLTDNVATGTLDQGYFSKYNTLVQACLATGAHCIIDIHNYARWNGEIIGQGGPSNEVFASLWSSLASHYANEAKVVFAIMNEPHDLPSITLWAETVQAAVTAIRKAGAATQMILLSGDHWTSAQTLVSGGSAEALAAITNPDGSHDNLIFDVHMYLDSDSSGTSDTCVTNHIADAWEPLAQWLRCNGRQALNTETGGGNTASCEEYMCQQIQYLAQNSDVFLGYTGWAAGSFETPYVLSETPTKNGGSWIDQLLVKACMAPIVNNYVALG